MSRGFNKVIIMGNLARDPDVRHTPSKQKVARITVAVGRQWKNKATGELENRTDFISVVAWGFSADICERYLAKGRPVLIEGRLQVRDYDDPKTGQHKWITEVLAENITLMSAGRREDGAESVPPPRARAAAPVQQKAGYQDFPGEEVASLRDQANFDEFPLDFSEMGDEEGPGDVDIPF